MRSSKPHPPSNQNGRVFFGNGRLLLVLSVVIPSCFTTNFTLLLTLQVVFSVRTATLESSGTIVSEFCSPKDIY